MACARVVLLCNRARLFTKPIVKSIHSSYPNSQTRIPTYTPRKLNVVSSLSTQHSIHQEQEVRQNRWKPMCLYFTQGKCPKMDDPVHLEKFDHNISMEFQAIAANLKSLCPQHLDYFLVLDLEGKVEILEFPVLMIDAKSLELIDSFHRFVRPTGMNEQRINDYIKSKYGKFGVDRVWHHTAISFKEVLEHFEIWITNHYLWKKELGGYLHRAAFVTCGNWDVKTKIPEQCGVSRIQLPPYFMEWINLKDIYLNFYKRRATGMMTMMKELGISMRGSHHLGIDDTKNIARILQRMLADGALLEITARRTSKDIGDVEFLFKDRISYLNDCQAPWENPLLDVINGVSHIF